MTDPEINVAVAELCGLERTDEYVSGWQRKGEPWNPCGLPNYCADLNAMHEAEKVLEHPEAYASRLGPIIQRDANQTSWAGSWGTTRWHFAFAHATARQRAEAFLRTLGKWKD